MNDLVNRALALTTGANIHEVSTVVAYYRNAKETETQEASLKSKRKEPRQIKIRRGKEILFYEAWLQHFIDTSGTMPKRGSDEYERIKKILL